MTKLQEMRKKRGIRPAELARRLNVFPSSICIAEKKGIRNAGAAERYAAVLRCRPEELMEFSRIRPGSATQGAIGSTDETGECKCKCAIDSTDENENFKCKCAIDGTGGNIKCKVLSDSTGKE